MEDKLDGYIYKSQFEAYAMKNDSLLLNLQREISGNSFNSLII